MKKNIIFSMFILILVLATGANQLYAAEKEPVKLININTAEIAELVKLPRIGEKTAQRIIEYRTKNGKFKKTEDLMKVKGIGEKTFQKFADKITV